MIFMKGIPMNSAIPKTQSAVQLTGPGQLRLNDAKAVFTPGEHQVLAKIECVGLCFSDLKLLKQFDQHARKSDIVRGVDPAILREMPHYVPGAKPTVPGHEVTCRIVAVGAKVAQHRVGERCLVQSDYRDLPTAGSNAAFGYNFEGALQEYVLFDERIGVDSHGERLLIPVPENLAASAIALVEPWACVEDSYVTAERQAIKPGGKLLLVADANVAPVPLADLLGDHLPAVVKVVAPDAWRTALDGVPTAASFGADIKTLPEETFDDILYFGADPGVIEILNDKLATRGIMNLILGGRSIGRPANIGVGRMHYGLTRWIGTTGSNPGDSYAMIPGTGEMRPGDSVVIIGAGGPMGQMHVLRAVSSGIDRLGVVGTDMDDARLASIESKARPVATANGVDLKMVNTAKTKVAGPFSYIALMAPVGALVAQAVKDAAPGAIVNIFAGIPAPTKQPVDLDQLIAKRCFLFGTSGSDLRDMKLVLEKVTSGRLDTNASVDAISGMKGAIDGIAAVENRTLAGKIIVYPMLHDLGLIPLSQLPAIFPTVAARLRAGQWTREAEQELLRVAGV